MKYILCVITLYVLNTFCATAQVKHITKKTKSVSTPTSVETGNFKLYHSYSRELDLAADKNKILIVPGNTLFDVLLKGIKDQKMKAYAELANPKTVADEPFSKPLTYKQLSDAINDVVMVDKLDKDVNKIGTKKLMSPFDQANLVAYRIKEIVYLNKQTGKAETQIIGIAPLRIIRLTNGLTVGSAPICWLKYKQCRPLLAQIKVSENPKTTPAIALSDVFQNRTFASKITEESNPGGLRIIDYIASPDERDKEADRIEKALAEYKANPAKY